jgi:hypothetical protein
VIWIVLAALGVPIWLVVGALLAGMWSRKRFQRAQGVFPCKVRAGSETDASEKWPRATAYARWVHDVLIVHAGLALVRNRALPVAGVDGPIVPAPDVKLKGGSPASLRLRLDDGAIVEVAAPAASTGVLAGPFDVSGATPTVPRL